MKVSFSSNIVEGPYGGGNTFLINLKQYLIERNHLVVHDLKDRDIDIILLINPLIESEHSNFNHIEILKYLKYKNQAAIVVQRFNECDERKNTKNVNKRLIEASKCSDYKVFVSKWLQELFILKGLSNKNNKVILGGSNQNLFNNSNKKKWEQLNKLKFVTHHWSSNWMKGFEIYKKFDELLEKKEFSDLFTLTYIGNLPKNFTFKNIEVLPPINQFELSLKLKEFDAYITGSINEPSGNHHVEAGLTGLPILYLKSGGVPEYCRDYGLEIDINNLEEKVYTLREQYDLYFEKMKYYRFTSEETNSEYLMLFEYLLDNKDLIISKRKYNFYFLLIKWTSLHFLYLIRISFIKIFYKITN